MENRVQSRRTTWRSYASAQSLQALQQVPVLQRSDDAHVYLLFALFDGTGHPLPTEVQGY